MLLFLFHSCIAFSNTILIIIITYLLMFLLPRIYFNFSDDIYFSIWLWGWSQNYITPWFLVLQKIVHFWVSWLSQTSPSPSSLRSIFSSISNKHSPIIHLDFLQVVHLLLLEFLPFIFLSSENFNFPINPSDYCVPTLVSVKMFSASTSMKSNLNWAQKSKCWLISDDLQSKACLRASCLMRRTEFLLCFPTTSSGSISSQIFLVIIGWGLITIETTEFHFQP